MRDQELVNALRCVSTAGGPMGDCKKCPFYKTEPVPEDLAGKVNLTEWSSCDVDAVGLAAADQLENQSAHIAALQQEIAGLRKAVRWVHDGLYLCDPEKNTVCKKSSCKTRCFHTTFPKFADALAETPAPQLRWIPVTERLPELQSWGASEVVLGLIKSENTPSLNKLHNLTLCVYCDNGIWSMPGRYVAITHWMPLPEPPEVENAETE